MSTGTLLPMTPPCSPIPEYPPQSPSVVSAQCLRPGPRQKLSRHQSRESFSSTLSGRFRTLIVDDNPVNLNILERTLKRHFSHLVSPDIVMASSGKAALCQLSPQTMPPGDEKPPPFTNYPTPTMETENPFDLILLDIDMPGGISGIQVAEQIRQVHNDQATAIVAVTTSTLPDQQRTYEMVGMDGVVGKPIDLLHLDRVVTRALLSRRARARPRISSVPPLLREEVVRSLEVQSIERLAQERLSSSTSGVSSPLFNFEGAISRRRSFPLSFEELVQMQESVSSTSLESDYVTDIIEAMTKVSLFE